MSKRKKRDYLFIVYPVLIFTLIFFIYQKNTLSFSSKIISPLPTNNYPSNIIKFFFTPEKNSENLKEKILELIADQWKNYSVMVVDYKTNQTLTINESIIFTAASVNKLYILAGLYYLIQKDEIDPDNTITLQSDDIQDYGTGSIRYDPAGTIYSIKTLARLMMQKSDNTAAYVLANHIIGINKLQQIINDWGFIQTDIVNNKTSNKDVALLMGKIINEKIASKAYTQEMLSLLKDSDFEDRLPALLPKTTLVYHKIGTEVGMVHDAGIVMTPNSKYYIGVFTSDITDEEQAASLIAKISKVVYDFYN